MSESTALISLEEQLKQELMALSDQVEPPSSNKISTKGKVFKLPGGKSSTGPLTCVVLDFIGVNMFYPGVYNPNVKVPPACWSVGKILKDMTPSAAIEKPQHTDCNGCPKNQWKSGPGGKGKACKNQRRLIIVPSDFDEKSEPLTLYVSPTGLKHFDKYVTSVKDEFAAVPIQVITEISFDPNQEFPTLLFNCKGKHANLEAAMKLRQRYAELLTREPEAQAA